MKYYSYLCGVLQPAPKPSFSPSPDSIICILKGYLDNTCLLKVCTCNILMNDVCCK